MKFALGLAALSFFAAANALPNSMSSQERFPVPDTMTVAEASAKCGDQAQLSCCNKATYGGDSTVVNDGLGAGLLSHLLGAGSAAQGLGAFEGCSKVDLGLLLVGQDILNQKCKQNIACCQKSGSKAGGDLVGASLPCIALGSLI